MCIRDRERQVTYVYGLYDYGSGYALKRLNEIHYPGGDKVTFIREGQGAGSDPERIDWATGRVSAVEHSWGSDTGKVSYSYQGLGAALKLTYFGQGGSQATLKYLKPSQSEELGFDRFGRVYRIKAQNGSTVILDYTYSYDRLGNPTQRTDSTALGKSETYRHDPTERLVALSRTGEDEKKLSLIHI